MFNKIDFNEYSDILARVGGSLVILRGTVFFFCVLLVKNKWMRSLEKSITKKMKKHDPSASVSQAQIIKRCSYEGIFDLTDKVAQQE